MRDDYFNPATYAVIDRITGEEVEIDIFIEKVKKGYWERAYASTLALYFGMSGSKSVDVLAYILSKKDHNNLFVYTWEEVQEDLGISKMTVAKVVKKAIAKGFIKKVRNGKYLISPTLLRHGSDIKGAMILKLWGDLPKQEKAPRKIGKLRKPTESEKIGYEVADECF